MITENHGYSHNKAGLLLKFLVDFKGFPALPIGSSCHRIPVGLKQILEEYGPPALLVCEAWTNILLLLSNS